MVLVPVRPDRRVTAALGIAALVFSPLAAFVLAPGAQADPAASVPSCDGTTCSLTFGYTGSAQTFTVPANVTAVSTTVDGAAGGTSTDAGQGGRTTATLAVTPGAQLTVVIGQQGSARDTVGTYGGGGATIPGSLGSSGGGGSFVFGPELLLAAGGGGGNPGQRSNGAAGGAGGGATGDNGVGVQNPDGYFYYGATGGTQSSGGGGGQFALGFPWNAYGSAGFNGSGPASDPATLGQGGRGSGSGGEEYGAGGGGGGGYYGGGGGGHYQGAGGGSGYAAPSATDVTSTNGANSGAGSVTFSWPDNSQHLLVTSAPPSTATVGDSHTLTIVGGRSTSPIAIAAVDTSVCSVGQVTGSVVSGAQHASAPISFLKRGSCQLTVTQAAAGRFDAAAPADVTTAVAARPTAVVLHVPGAPVVYGQPLSADVATSPGVAGTIHVTRATGDGPVAVLDKHIDAGDGDTAVALTLPVGANQLSSTFVPDDLDHHAASSTDVAATATVTPASSSTVLRVTKTQVVATVTAQAPSKAVPTGSVQFALGSSALGAPVPLVDGTATLTYRVPAGRAHELSATYLGQGMDTTTAVTGSVATAARQNPTITARVTSAAHKSRSGWYSGPVTVRFTCAAGSAPVVRCPAPVTITHEGVRTVTRTITTEDGGAAMRSVTVKIDRSRPSVAVRGVRVGRVYDVLPKTACRASDTVSGVAACRVVRHVHGDRVAYRATAVDHAGHTRSVRVVVLRPHVGIVGARYGGTRPTVHNGRTYTLVVAGKTRPSYVNAAPAPSAPKGDGGHFAKVGKNRWAYVVTLYRTKSHSIWNFGVRVGHKTTVTTVRIR